MSVPDKLKEELLRIRSNKPTIFLDYDGTLVPIRMDPEKCYPDDDLLKSLKRLRKDYRLFIVTGRSLEDITKFVGTEFDVIALHGAVKRVDGALANGIRDMQRYVEACNSIFVHREEYERRFRGLRMYNKNGNILFHTGLMGDEDQKIELGEMIRLLSVENGMDIYRGKMIIELRIPGINKGVAIKSALDGNSSAIIAGDDVTDEDAFRENPHALKIKVGGGPTLADYSVDDYRDIRKILDIL